MRNGNKPSTAWLDHDQYKALLRDDYGCNVVWDGKHQETMGVLINSCMIYER